MAVKDWRQAEALAINNNARNRTEKTHRRGRIRKASKYWNNFVDLL